MDRINNINYYLDIAQTEMERGNLLDRNYGAIIVRDDVIVSTGYSYMAWKDGSPQGSKQHAEATAINAATGGLTRGAALYLVGRDMQTGELLTDTEPCLMCMRLIIKAGIEGLFNRISPTDYNAVHVGLNWDQKDVK